MRPKHADRPVYRPSFRTALTGLAALAVAATAVVTGSASYGAAPTQTTFVDEGFTGTTAGSGYTLPGAPSGVNQACLTARSSTVPTATDTVPGCGGSVDADGNGALRLTSASLNQTGGVGARQSVPITKGIDAVFDSYQYNGTADGTGTTADGIVFYLAATDPYNPAVPTQIGQLGGSLGYSSTTSQSGLAHAYLGIGLDRYGNFNNVAFGGNGCQADAGRTRFPNSVTVRGPGNGTTGYCVVTSTAPTAMVGSLSKSGVTDRSQAKVPVEIVINPTGSPLPAQKATDVTVQGGTFAVIFTPIGGTRQVLTGSLPQLDPAGNQAGVPGSWIDPATKYPYKLTYGWVAGTGGASDVHEVNYLEATTVAGPVPVLSAVASGDSSVAHGGSGTYTVTPTVTSDGGTESQLIRTTTTFPAGVQPTLPTAAAGWACSIAGQVETCDYAVDASAPVQPGTTLPALSLPYTVSGAARTATVSTVVASTDAEAVTVSRDVAVQPQQVLVTAGDVTAELGATASLTATVASTATSGATTPTGTVTFTDQATNQVLCTATLSQGVATCTTVAAAIGAHTVLVGYSGDGDHAAVTGADRPSLALTVTKVSVTLDLSVAPSDVPYGTAATLSALGIPSGAQGTLTFSSAAGELCTTTLPVTSCPTSSSLAAGTYAVSVAYSGDATYAAATSATSPLTVRKATATIGGPGTTGGGTGGGGTGGGNGGGGGGGGDTVTVTHGGTTDLTVDGLPTDATGTISFVTDDGTVLCTATLPATTCALPADLPGGEYTVHSVYSGDDNYEGLTGPTFTLRVTAQKTALTARPSVTGSGVTLTASGLPAGATGTVVFRDADGRELCTVTLPATSCRADGLAAGTHSITATYSGDASFASSTSIVTVTVTADPALASTGSAPAIGAGVAGAAVLLLGGALVLLRRRRTASGAGTEV